MSGMWATPVIRVNHSGISGEGQESARNLPFPGQPTKGNYAAEPDVHEIE